MKIILTHVQGPTAGTIDEFDTPLVRIGRDPRECDIVFNSTQSPGVSRVHAEITMVEGGFYLEDLNSRNGTFVDTRQVQGKIRLSPGQFLQFGSEGPILKFDYDTEFKSKAPETRPAQAVQVTSAGIVCRSCGATFTQFAKFCRRCGTPIDPSIPAPADNPEITMAPLSPEEQHAREKAKQAQQAQQAQQSASSRSAPPAKAAPAVQKMMPAQISAPPPPIQSMPKPIVQSAPPPPPISTPMAAADPAAYVPPADPHDMRNLLAEEEAKERRRQIIQEASHAADLIREAELLKAPPPTRICYSCGSNINGDPRFCPRCGAVLSPDSARLHSDELDTSAPPAATAYVSLGKIEQQRPERKNPPRQSELLKNKPKVKNEPPPRVSSQLNKSAPTKSGLLNDKSINPAKVDIPRVMRPSPLIPPKNQPNSVVPTQTPNVASSSIPARSTYLSDPRNKPSSPGQTLLLSAQALAKKGHVNLAIEECERALRLDAQLPETYNYLGQLLLSRGDYDKAIAAFEKALKLKPTMAEAFTNLGQAYLRSGRFEDAALSAREAIKLDQVIPEAYYTIGQALMEIGDFDRAFEAFSRALRLRPDYAESYLGMAMVHLRCGHTDDVINYCQQAIKVRPQYAQAYCMLGQSLRSKGKFAEAEQALREAIKIKPDYAAAYNYLALNYRSQNLIEQALSICSKALEIDANLPEALNTMGLLYCDCRRYPEGLVEYQKALVVRPRYAEAHNNLGLCHFKMGAIDLAIECFEKAIEIESQFALARFNLALCYFKKRDKYNVKKHYEVLCGIDEARAAKLYQKIKTLIA